MKTLFLITSALSTRFGVYTLEQRLAQTLDTIQSIRSRLPSAKIMLIELSGATLDPTIKQTLHEHVEGFMDFSQDPNVIGIYHSTDNWDIVKNITEVMGFKWAITALQENHHFNEYDRVFKISGRYQLSDAFDIHQYTHCPDRIVLARKRTSQFDPRVTGGITYQYMSRLWSWPTQYTEAVIQTYTHGLNYMVQTIDSGRYCDTEHMLYQFLPAELVTEFDPIGVHGHIAPTGQYVAD